MDQAAPSHCSMRFSLWPALSQYPTAVQAVAEVHEIPARALSAPAVLFGLERIDHGDGLVAPAGVSGPALTTNVKAVKRSKNAPTRRVRPLLSFPNRDVAGADADARAQRMIPRSVGPPPRR